jgi:hypothetical protein
LAEEFNLRLCRHIEFVSNTRKSIIIINFA